MRAAVYGIRVGPPRVRCLARCQLTLLKACSSVPLPSVRFTWIFHGAQVYAIAVYAEGDLAARELAVRKRGGFFDVDAD